MPDRAKYSVQLVAMAWGAVSLAGVTAAVATPPSGDINRNELAVGKVTDQIKIDRTEPSDFYIQVVTIAPGANAGWHTHPGPEYSIVKAGEIILLRAPNCQPIRLKAGQGFFTPAGVAHTAQNDGQEPAELYVTYTVPSGDTKLRVDAGEQCGAEPAPAPPQKQNENEQS